MKVFLILVAILVEVWLIEWEMNPPLAPSPSAEGAFVFALPVEPGEHGQILVSDGTTLRWVWPGCKPSWACNVFHQWTPPKEGP